MYGIEKVGRSVVLRKDSFIIWQVVSYEAEINDLKANLKHCSLLLDDHRARVGKCKENVRNFSVTVYYVSYGLKCSFQSFSWLP